jgi:hypothetical protein
MHARPNSAKRFLQNLIQNSPKGERFGPEESPKVASSSPDEPERMKSL